MFCRMIYGFKDLLKFNRLLWFVPFYHVLLNICNTFSVIVLYNCSTNFLLIISLNDQKLNEVITELDLVLVL